MKYSWYSYLVIILSIGFFSLLSLNMVLADESHNVRGLASSSKGYISFNCLDDDFFGRFTHTFSFYFHVPACSLSQHGVNLDDKNNFSGTAWSPAIGYLDFGSAAAGSAPSYDFNANCLKTCDTSNNCFACYNYNDQRIYGWAYLAPNQWIRLDSNDEKPLIMSNYNASPPGIFRGLVAATSTDFGPISFNCLSDDSCGIDDYKVYMWKLTLHSMSAPNWNFTQACDYGAKRAVLKWQLKSGTQSAFRVIINTVNSTSSPVFDSLKINKSATQLACPGVDCGNWQPEYNTSYYWWLQLWDENDAATEWFQFNTETMGELTGNEDGYNEVHNPTDPHLTFTSYRHAFPHPLFSYNPPEIYVGTSTHFVSESEFFTDAQPVSPQPCVDGDCFYLWFTSRPDQAIISSSTEANTDIVFKNTYAQSVSLTVTDSNAYMCTYTEVLANINFQLPLWKEVKAE